MILGSLAKIQDEAPESLPPPTKATPGPIKEWSLSYVGHVGAITLGRGQLPGTWDRAATTAKPTAWFQGLDRYKQKLLLIKLATWTSDRVGMSSSTHHWTIHLNSRWDGPFQLLLAGAFQLWKAFHGMDLSSCLLAGAPNRVGVNGNGGRCLFFPLLHEGGMWTVGPRAVV